MDEQEGDQQPADTAVAVEEWVDGLELRMCQAGVDECGQLLLVQEALEVVERLLHLVDRGRHERRLCQARVLRPDPVLRAAKLAGETVSTATAGQELTVDLADQAERERQLAKPIQAVVHRVDVADDLVDVLRQPAPSRTGLELDREQILERALRPLDLRAEHSLAPDVHVDEEVRVRNGLDDAVQATDGLIGPGQERVQLTVEGDRRVGRERRRDERRVARALFHIAAGARTSGGHRSSLVS